MSEIPGFLSSPPAYLFFTGKGGVGKTSTACSAAILLAGTGKRILLVSTDPASNLDEVLETALDGHPKPVESVPGLYALNIDPERAARDYRERVLGPVRGALPKAALQSIEEQLSGACTTEIAAFDEFSKLLGSDEAAGDFDHVVFDTAPTGHTLRLLELPSAWDGFIEENAGGTSCLGPLSGLTAQRSLYASAKRRLADPAMTLVVLVSRPEVSALSEAERTRLELAQLSVENLHLVVNGVFEAAAASDTAAAALEARGKAALAGMPPGLAALSATRLPLLPFPLLGTGPLAALFASGGSNRIPREPAGGDAPPPQARPLEALIGDLAKPGRGVIMLMGKGGVGKTRLAVAVAEGLARRGRGVHLTTTDPAAHIEEALGDERPGNLRVCRIDPETETRKYREGVLASAGADLDEKGKALLEEELRSPCTEEIAVFQAFARTVDEAEAGFVVIDTAPTGHTLLLLDAAEAYHREVSKSMGGVPDPVRKLLPHLRDAQFTKVLVATLPEATPVHEAQALQDDLRRAGIEPFGWIVNQCWSLVKTEDPVLRERRRNEAAHLRRVEALSERVALVPWSAEERVAKEAVS